MIKRIALNIIFYGLIISTAIGAGIVYERNFVGSNQQPNAIFVNSQPANQNAPVVIKKNPPTKTNVPAVPIKQTPTKNPPVVTDNNPPPVSNVPPSNQNQNIPMQNTNAGRCIITVFGQQYDVTDLQYTHSGGDVFDCGTDMTSVFQSQHGNNTRLIQRYLIN